jgi:galactose mutarotase-like enzyme
VNLFEAPALAEGAARMNGSPEDFNGNVSFMIGGSILVPYANRIRGKLLEKDRLLETNIAGKTVRLPANWKGKNPGAEVHAMHGLILGQAMGAPVLEATPTAARATVSWDAGDFGGHWPSRTALSISCELTATGFSFSVKSKNTGTELLPVGAGWHPYFVFPSGDRQQARLRIPASRRALVDNYDNVFPTGQLADVAGTPYDFSGPTGAPLGKLFLDDCFVNLNKDARNRTVSEITDPAAKYGIRVIGASPEITAIQVYAPVDKAFVAFEPQFNWADPYSAIWKGAATGMVALKPGEETTYTVALELFTPPA